MAGSSRTTFAKRQKERQRQEKQAEKAQRKLQRKAQDQEQDPNAPEKPKDLTVTYNEEGIPEGFGFIQMPNDDEADKAMAALNGKDSGGRALTVNEARPQAPRSFGGGGGRGNDRGGNDRGGPRQRREPRW